MNFPELTAAVACLALASCAQIPQRAPDPAHLHAPVQRAEPPSTPPVVAPFAPSAPPVPSSPPPRYSVAVSRVAVTELLHAIARDAGLELDIHPGVGGVVTLNAVDQPLPHLLSRISRQTDLRLVLDGNHLTVTPDTPYLRSYRVDYVNLSRSMNAAIATSTQIATSSSGVEGKPSGSGNTSLTQIETSSANRFWESLEGNIRAILKEHARFIAHRRCEQLRAAGGHGMEGEAAPGIPCDGDESAEFVMVNRETGILMIRANGTQHEAISDFITQVQGAARRQVMIEATIVEVALKDGYRQGIDWTRLGSPGGSFRPRSGDADASALSPTLSYLSGALDIRLELLESFGTVKVLSSPRLSVLNNQTAVLKVVEEVVYFLVDASTTTYGDGDREKITATTTPQSVSVGMVLALTPQISAGGDITLNIRPTISSISGFRDDPNPSLGDIPNRVPQIRTREIESVLRLASGEIAVLGGLMEDKLAYDTGRIPLVGAIPLLGELFTRRENGAQRTELVIFLRPQLIDRPGLGGDFAAQAAQLPTTDFFRGSLPPGALDFPGVTPSASPEPRR